MPCPVFLVGNEGRNLETSLAAHPTDPATLLVTWTERNATRFSAHVWAAVTHDGGASWVKTALHDPALVSPTGAELLSYDSTAAFGPDGTAYVLYGGETDKVATIPGPACACTTDRITLAASKTGETWDYHPLSVTGPQTLYYTFGTDAMTLAVAPDSGRIYVVTNLLVGPQPIGPWFWASDDRGQTWTQKPLDATPDQSAFHLFPRAGAGPNGQVDVALDEVDPTGRMGRTYWMLTSHDGGGTFAKAQLPAGATYGRGTPLVTSSGHSVAVFTADAVGVAESTDGLAWTFHALAKANGDSVSWVMDAASASGVVAVMTELLTCGRPASMSAPDGALATSWEMRFAIAKAAGPTGRNITGLSDKPPQPNSCGYSNEYGGLAYAADGALWGAWSDLRGSENPRIAVARLA